MFLKQAEIFEAMPPDFIRAVMALAEKKKISQGAFLFQWGDPADNYYILLEGNVRLTVGPGEKEVYTVKNPGESFGWSSLVDRETYSASARCSEPCEVIIIHRNNIQQVIENSPEHGWKFYKRLAEILGSRLISMYEKV